ncbi:MAG: geranylgeranylglyceryl/heptaprenylglyceryl phosphate synthase [Thermoplasmata archaeon]
MNVLNYILKTLENRKMHMTLLDPAKQTPEKSAEIAELIEKLGTDAIMIGGSTNITQSIMDKTILKIKSVTKTPIIIFPNGVQSISKYADAIYFMSLLNSSDRAFLIENQMMAAPLIKKLGLEPIPMGYIIIEPGMAVGRVGKAILLKKDEISKAVGYALAAEFLGMKLVYFEAGSGSPEPVNENLISAVKNEVNIPIIVGGGITDIEKARKILNAGASIIVTGTLVERFPDYDERLKGIIGVVRGAKIENKDGDFKRKI